MQYARSVEGKERLCSRIVLKITLAARGASAASFEAGQAAPQRPCPLPSNASGRTVLRSGSECRGTSLGASQPAVDTCLSPVWNTGYLFYNKATGKICFRSSRNPFAAAPALPGGCLAQPDDNLKAKLLSTRYSELTGAERPALPCPARQPAPCRYAVAKLRPGRAP